MSTAAVMMVKDEADIVATTVRHLLTQVDDVIVADNLSTDGTTDILRRLEFEYAGFVTVLSDPEVGYWQARKTTALAMRALDRGHEWVVPCDADEIWGSSFGRLGDVLADHTGVDVVTAEMFDHVPTSLDDPYRLDPVARIGWRRQQRGPLPKVACRLAPELQIEMGNHVANYGARPTRVHEWAVTIRHFPYRSPEQFVRKAVNGAAAYAASDLGDEYGGHWRGYGAMVAEHGPKAAHGWYHAWFYSDNPPHPPAACRGDDDPQFLLYDPAPLGGVRPPTA